MLAIAHYHQLMDDIINWVTVDPKDIERHVKLTIDYQNYVKNEIALNKLNKGESNE